MGFAKGLTMVRRNQVGMLWLRGYTERAIAEIIRTEARKPRNILNGCEKTNHITVHRDIQACRTEWLERDRSTLDEKRSEQVSRLLEIIRQAWRDFNECGNDPRYRWMRPQYLRIALDGEEKLSKILGTTAPIKVESNGYFDVEVHRNGDSRKILHDRLVKLAGKDVVLGDPESN